MYTCTISNVVLNISKKKIIQIENYNKIYINCIQSKMFDPEYGNKKYISCEKNNDNIFETLWSWLPVITLFQIIR